MTCVQRGASYGVFRSKASRAMVVLALVGSLFVVAPPPALAAPFTVFFDSAASSVSESGTSIAVTVVLSTGGELTTDAIEVEVAAAPGSADATDFSYTNDPIVFPAGSDDGATQTASITINPDGDHEADETIDLGLAVTEPGADGGAAVEPISHVVTILDDDPATVSFSAAASSTAESGTNTTTVALSVPGGGSLTADVTVNIVDDGTGDADVGDDYTLTTTSVTFLEGAADAAELDVDVAVVPDDIDESDETIDLSLDLVSGPAQVSGTHQITILDDDTAGVTVSTPSLSVTEGGATVEYTIVLDSEPTGSVTVGAATSTGEATVTPSSRVFTPANWDSPQIFTVEAFDDAAIDGTTGDTIVHTATSAGDGLYNGISVADLAVTVNDDDSAGVSVSESSLSITEGGAPGTYTAVLTSAPTDDVVITPSNADGAVLVTPASRTFTPANWGNPRQFSVTVPNDEVAEGSRVATITHAAQSNDGNYNGLTIGSVVVNIQDDDLAVAAVADQSINEGDVFPVSVTFNDPDGAGSHEATIDWGDGSAIHSCPGLCNIVDNGDGTGTVTGSHQYLDNGIFTVTVRVFDGSGDEGSGDGTATVANVDPVAEITDTAGNILGLTYDGGEEGSRLRLRSTLEDPGADEFTYQWAIRRLGPPNPPIVASSSTNRINYTPVENGVYFATLTVEDDDGGMSFRSVQVTIDNALPVIERIAFDATPPIGASVDLEVFWSDPGSDDTHTVTVDWGEGSEDDTAGTSPLSFAKTYSSAGTRSAEVCVQDDDGGRSCEPFYVNPGVVFSVDSDFNGDGNEDLAVGVPGEDGGAGAVNVLYGARSGIKAGGDDLWKQGTNGIAGSKEGGDGFGSALAWGDFDLDGYSDLAVAAPSEDISGVADAGIVHIIYGSASGLSSGRDTTFHQNAFGVADSNQRADRFGTALAVGDFNGDAFADLAIGVPYEDIDGVANTGRVAVLFGSPTGLTSNGNESWDQNSPRIKGANSAGDRFGETLAAGDFDLDGFWDLAIGAPRKSVGGRDGAGSLLVIGGALLGLDAGADRKWDQDSGTMADSAEAGDRFTAALEVGDFNGDGRPDLAVGVPDEAVSGKSLAGAVAVMLSGSSGLSDSGNTLWHEDVPGVLGTVEAKDRFGFALAAGDFDDDGRDDLAIGIPYQNVGSRKSAGDVAVLYGGAAGLTAAGDQRWNENTPGIRGRSQRGDHLGWALRAFDQDNDGDADLAIGIPDQDVNGDSNAGAVLVLKGRSGAITSAGDGYWHQDRRGVREATGRNDKFGRAL